VNDYDDEIESIEACLESMIELLAETRDYLHQGLVIKASDKAYELKSWYRRTDAYTHDLSTQLEREAKK